MQSIRLPGRMATAALCRCAAIGVVAAVIAGCGIRSAPGGDGAGGTGAGNPAGGTGPASPGTGSAGPGAGSASPGGRSPAAAAAACWPSGIRVTLDLRSAGVAAGTSYVPLDFTNISALPCRLGGFPTVTLASRSGQQIGTAGRADTSAAAESLMLTAGQTAHVWLHLLDVVNLPAARCRPAAAAGLRVALPGQASATFISHALTTCGKQIHGTDILTVEPFRPGQARPGTAR